MVRRVAGDHRFPGRGRRGYKRDVANLAYHRMPHFHGPRAVPPARRIAAAVCATVAVGAVGLSLVPAAATSTTSTTNSAARFLSGSLPLASTSLDSVAALGGVTASSQTGHATQTSANPLTLSALGSQLINLPGGVSLPLSTFLNLGAVNQYAQANPDGTTRSAAGAVDNTGAVDTSPSSTFPSDATVDLVGLLGAPATGVLSTGSLTLGGITAVAATTAGHAAPATTCTTMSSPQDCRDYTIARGSLNLVSPLIATLVSSLGTALDTISGTVDSAVSTDVVNSLLSAVTGLLTTLNGLVPGVSLVSNTLAVSITTNLRTAVSSVLNQTLSDSVVSIDLSTGTISVDLNALTGGLNNLPPNTHVLTSAQINSLISHIGALLGSLQTQLVSAVTTALNAVTVTISGGVCLLFVVTCTAGLDISYNGTLGDLVGGASTLSVSGTGLLSLTGPVLTTVLSTLQSALGTAVGPDLTSAVTSITSTALSQVTTLTSALDPVLQLLNSLLDLVVNVQEPGSTSGSYREVALRAALGSGSIATLDLARAEVAAQTQTAPSTPASTTPASTTPTSTPSSTPHTVTTASVPRIDSGLGAAAAYSSHPRRLSMWTLGGAAMLLLAAAMLLLTREAAPNTRRAGADRS